LSWKIGDLIKKTGLTARTLHYYEEKGLIGPISRSDAGHRLYEQVDLIRLQQIRNMRFLGVQISDMSSLINDDINKLKKQLQDQLESLKLKRSLIEKFESRTSKLLVYLDSDDINPESLDNYLFKTMETMMMYEKYFKQSDIDKMHDNDHDNKSEQNNEETWNQWVKSMKSELLSGTNPQSKKVQNLMKHWNDIVHKLTDGDEMRMQAFNDLMHNEPQARLDHGIDDALFDFMSKASSGH